MRRLTTSIVMGSLLFAVLAQAETRQEYLWDALQRSAEDGIQLAPGVDVGIVVEVDGRFQRQDGKDTSAFKLATFELGIEAALLPYLTAAGTLLWEEGATEPVDLDSAYIRLGGTDEIPVALKAGLYTLPFGSFKSLMLSDPMTLTLGETGATTVGLEYEHDLFAVWAGLFSSNLDNSDTIEKGAVAALLTPVDGVTLGAGYLSDIAEGGYQDGVNALLGEDGRYKRAAGWNAYGTVRFAPVTLHAEYLAAAKAMEFTDAEGAVTKANPKTWTIEAMVDATDVLSAGFRYENSKEFKPGEMPEHQYGPSLSYSLNRFTTLRAEYLFGTFEGDTADRHMVNTRIAVAF